MRADGMNELALRNRTMPTLHRCPQRDGASLAWLSVSVEED
jgi:hypothetical protein